MRFRNCQMKGKDMDYIETGRTIYTHLADDISKGIFCHRTLYSMTGDVDHIQNLVESSIDDSKLITNAFECFGKTYIFGAGTWGKEIAHVWGSYITAFLDNDSKKNDGSITLEGIPILSPMCLLEDEGPKTVIIGTRLYYADICHQLEELGIKNMNIINIGAVLDKLAEKQYFDLEALTKQSKEIFADIGCFDGMSSLRFFKWSDSSRSKAICFEPDPDNVLKCEGNLKDYISTCAVEIIRKGAWSKNTTLKFASRGNGSSTTSEEFMKDDKTIEIEVTKLDDIFRNRDVTFIKMDIEGAEYEALKGCEETIRNKKPKLAICVYHKPEDIFVLPKLILDYCEEYKLYLRHYSIAAAETVLYAIPLP